MRYATVTILLASAMTTAAGTASAQSDNGEAAALIATQVREQGYACAEPATAKPDAGDSEVGERAWILTCKDGSYRVRLVPDQAATVEKID